MTDPVEEYLFGTPTICRDCDNLVLKTDEGLKVRSEVGGETIRSIWNNFYCGAKTCDTGVDYVTGQLGYISVNDLGLQAIVDEPYPHCRNINTDGNCPDFAPTEVLVDIK